MTGFEIPLAVGAMALSAVGAISQGISANNQANYQADVARQQAERERQEATIRAEDFTRQESAMMAKRHAALGGSGVEAGSGSPLLVSEDFAGEAALGAARIVNGGEVNATRLEQSASLQEAAGRNAMRSGIIGAGASVARTGSLLFAPSGSTPWKPGKIDPTFTGGDWVQRA